MRRPPTDVPPERLWRILIAKPRAQWALRYRVRGAEAHALRVVALRGLEAEEALECDDAERRACAMIAAAVWTGNERAFSSADDVMLLHGGEVAELAGEVFEAISRVSPTFARVDRQAWASVLEDGAGHPSNIATAARVATCVDVAVGWKGFARTPRPDRWFGMPMGDLTDGQLMAFDAARAVFEKDKA